SCLVTFSVVLFYFFFFFSSRRRHTRSKRDWSSDVCSSDLLFLGTIPLFIIAGIIEGFITPSTLSLEVKYAVALITIIGLLLYVIWGKLLLEKKRSHKS